VDIFSSTGVRDMCDVDELHPRCVQTQEKKKTVDSSGGTLSQFGRMYNDLALEPVSRADFYIRESVRGGSKSSFWKNSQFGKSSRKKQIDWPEEKLSSSNGMPVFPGGSQPGKKLFDAEWADKFLPDPSQGRSWMVNAIKDAVKIIKRLKFG
jgi:hypothetical protein